MSGEGHRSLGLTPDTDAGREDFAYTKEASFDAIFADAQEGVCTSLEKRKPEWKGR